MNTFKSFNQDALDAYVAWVKEKHQVDLTLSEPPTLPNFTQLLAGQPDAIASNGRHAQWPVLVKKVWQSALSVPKTVEEIATSRSNFYLEKNDQGKWTVKQFTPVYFACQNIMMLNGYKNMDLICFNERNANLLVVGVPLETEAYVANMQALRDYLAQAQK